MAVYILGAGAFCCTDAYDAWRYRGETGYVWQPDFRPPLIADFFKVASGPSLGMLAKCPILADVGLTVGALATKTAGFANVETVLSLLDLVGRAIAHWVGAPARYPGLPSGVATPVRIP